MSGGARPLVSAALIVRDEAEVLRRCLSSVASWCDELVVVDTGSVDDSVEVARSFGAVQDVFPWTGDFAAARNRSLDLVTGEWVLYIDADEWIEPLAREDAHAELERCRDGVSVRLWRRDRPGFSPFREYRLWRNRPDIRFQGLIHETTVPDIHRITRAEGRPYPTSDLFRMQHDGYEGDQTAKHRRNLPLLERRVVEAPWRVYLWNHLGNVREALGDEPGAVEAWTAGIEVVRRYGIRDATDALVYAGLGHWRVRHGLDATDLLDEADLVAPWFKALLWVRALDHRRQGRHEQAVAPLRRLLQIGPDTLDPVLTYNNEMFTGWAWDALSDTLVVLGRRAEAADVLATAAAARPGRRDYLTKSLALRALADLDEQPGRQQVC